MKRHIIFILVLSMMSSLMLYGCDINNISEDKPQKNIEEPIDGGRIILGTEGNINTINPILVSQEGEEKISNIVFKGLVKLDKELKVVSDVAKSWTVSDDGLEWTFVLKKESKWSDGTPITSKDVVFTFNQIFDIKIDSPLIQKFQNLASFKALDDSRVVFKLFQPDAFFLNELTVGILPSHIFEGKEIEPEAFKGLTLGNGPFKVSKWDSVLKEIILEKNGEYYDKIPYIDEVVFKFFPDKESQKSAFKAGEIDVVEIANEDSPMYQYMENVKTYQFPNMYYEFIALNLKKNMLFQDIRVRQALMYGIDREKIQKDLLLNKGTVINSPVLPYSWAFNDNLESYPYEPKKALSLLQEAGWELSETDGFLYNINPNTGSKIKFEFKLIVNEENNTRIQVAETIKQNLKDLGISVEVITKPWDEVKKHIERKDFDAVFAAWKLDMTPDIQFAFHSKEINKGYNFVSYSNQDIDEISLSIRRTMDLKNRKELLFKGQKIINTELPYLFLYTKDRILAVKSQIKGISSSPNSFFWNIEYWWQQEA